MLSIKGEYKNGKIILKERPIFNETKEVIITFLDKSDVETHYGDEHIDINKFSFLKSQDMLKELQIDLSEEIIKERRSYL